MKILLILFLFAAAVSSIEFDTNFIPRHGIPPAETPRKRVQRPTWGTISQKLDNFDPLNSRTWSMRYIESGQFYKPGGPIFIMLGAEWTIDEGWLLSSQMVDMAEIHGAYMYYTEHRYYGKSYPTSDLSTANLRYLSTAQALADVANFIITMKRNPNLRNSKVVVFGGSYGGTMATWMREKYPNLVYAAVASSAPLLAKVDFNEYQEVVKKDLGKKCATILMNASAEVRRLLAIGQASKVERDFNLCYPFQSELDVQALFMYMSSGISGKIQYAEADTVNNICSQLQGSSSISDYDRLVGYTADKYCKGNYDLIVSYYKNTALNSGDSRQWFYQTCSQYGFFQTAWGDQSLYNYGISVDMYNQQCRDVFGPSFTPAAIAHSVDVTNQDYGALNPPVTRVVSVHGNVDPWHAIGLSHAVNPSTPTYVVNGTAHCQDMFSLDNWANDEMYYAKQDVLYWVDKWLQEP